MSIDSLALGQESDKTTIDKTHDLCDAATMQTFSATEVKQGFGAALDTAQREPVLIRKQDRDVAVLMSIHEYNKLRGQRWKAFDCTSRRIASKAKAQGLTDRKLAALLADES